MSNVDWNATIQVGRGAARRGGGPAGGKPGEIAEKSKQANRNHAKDNQRLAKLYGEEPESFDHKKLPREVAAAIRRRRNELEMPQKDFAMKINEKASLVAEYESGKVSPPNAQILGKMERVLGVKLRGKTGIGDALESKFPKKK